MYLLMNMLSIFPQYEALFTKIFFLLLTIALMQFAYHAKKIDWFIYSMFMGCVYAIIDELTGRACIIDWWEPIIFLLILFINFKNRNNKVWTGFLQKLF